MGQTVNQNQVASDPNQLQFRRIQQNDIYFKKYLDDEFRQSRFAMPENIRKARNYSIIFSFVEVLCIVASLALYARRRSRVLLAIIILIFFTCLLGVYSKVRLSYWGLLTHAVITISVIGGFFLYTIIDIAIGTDRPQGSGIGETAILLLLSLPLLVIFILGITSLNLFLDVDDELEERKKNLKRDGDAGNLYEEETKSNDLARQETVIEVLTLPANAE